MSTPRLSKSLDDVRDMVFGQVEEVQEEYAAKGWLPSRMNLNKGVVRGLLEIFCWALYQLYQLLAAVFVQASPLDATDEEWMEWHAEQVEAPRKQATKALGSVRFARVSTSGNVVIPKGKLVRTLADGLGNVYRFVTTESAVIQDGQNEAAVPVEAEEYGSSSNVTAGQIVEMVTTIQGVDAITNNADWLTSEGADQETLAALQARYVLRWMGNNGMTKHAYLSWALSVTGVVSALVLDQHPRGQGTVDVVVRGSAGVPTDSLLQKVRLAIAAGAKDDEVQAGPPINDDWQAIAPEAIGMSAIGELVLAPGTHAETAIAAAEQYIRALYQDTDTISGVRALGIGEDVPLDRLTAAAMLATGVKKVNWSSPIEDVNVPVYGLAVLSGVTLTASEAEEA